MTRSIISVTAEYESTTEMIANFKGKVANAILREEDKPRPDARKIQAMQLKLESARKDRAALNPDDTQLTAKTLARYKRLIQDFDGGALDVSP